MAVSIGRGPFVGSRLRAGGRRHRPRRSTRAVGAFSGTDRDSATELRGTWGGSDTDLAAAAGRTCHAAADGATGPPAGTLSHRRPRHTARRADAISYRPGAGCGDAHAATYRRPPRARSNPGLAGAPHCYRRSLGHASNGSHGLRRAADGHTRLGRNGNRRRHPDRNWDGNPPGLGHTQPRRQPHPHAGPLKDPNAIHRTAATRGPVVARIPSSDLDAAALASAMAGRRIGVVRAFGEVASTMDVAARLAVEGAPDGTVVLADHQTAGRGRLGRVWQAPPGEALLLSILFRPALDVTSIHQVPMAVALGALHAIRLSVPAGIGCALKWPNDIVAAGGKVGGMLAETGLRGDRIGHVVVGLGLNVHQATAALPIGATSLSQLGVVTRRDQLAEILLAEVDERYGELLAGGSLLEDWAAALETPGKRVVARGPAGTVRGLALGVAADGALLIRDDDGREHALRAADVTLERGSQ